MPLSVPGCGNAAQSLVSFKPTTNQEEQTFGSSLPLEYFENWCPDAFGADLTSKILHQSVIETNEEYQGLSPDVTNVVWVNGVLDPWHPLGITSDLNKASPAILIHGASHCADMLPSDPDDSQEMGEAKKRIGSLVSQWVTESRPSVSCYEQYTQDRTQSAITKYLSCIFG